MTVAVVEAAPAPPPLLTPPHGRRKSWDDHCPHCDAEPLAPCRYGAYKAPLIWRPDLGDHVPYGRASSIGKVLDDPTQLIKWRVRTVIVGLLKRPGLMSRVAGALANGNPDDEATKRELNRIADEAFEAGDGSDKASRGSGLHALTEAIDRGQTPALVPDADRPRLDAYRAVTAGAGYVPLSAEGFVVVDALEVAGSYDRLWLCPDGRVRVGDLKSGAWDADYPTGVATQLSIYAHGATYDPATGTRTPLHPDLDLTTGLLIHMPPTDLPRGAVSARQYAGGCRVVPLDMERGWYVARLAAAALATRKWKKEDLWKEIA